MIVYLANKQIDYGRWDACIARSVNRRVYAFSWYLDLVSPGWEALVEDDYHAVMPLTRKSRFGIAYLAQPFYTQQLGVFSADLEKVEYIDGFIREIPYQFRLVEINFNSMNKTQAYGLTLHHRKNHELDLQPVYQDLWSCYHQNAVRNLKKAGHAGITTAEEVPVDALVRLFSGTFGKKEGILKEKDYATLHRLISYSVERKYGFTRGVTKGGHLISGAFFLCDADRIYLLLAASAPEARQNGSTFYVIDQVIREYAGLDRILDFEGGNNPDLGRFYKGFGARETTYPALRLDRLPGIYRLGYNLARKFRG